MIMTYKVIWKLKLVSDMKCRCCNKEFTESEAEQENVKNYLSGFIFSKYNLLTGKREETIKCHQCVMDNDINPFKKWFSVRKK